MFCEFLIIKQLLCKGWFYFNDALISISQKNVRKSFGKNVSQSNAHNERQMLEVVAYRFATE